MKKTILVLAVFGITTLTSLCYGLEQRIDANMQVNADTNAGVSTSMNGNTSTSAGTSISSTSASAESRHTSGGD